MIRDDKEKSKVKDTKEDHSKTYNLIQELEELLSDKEVYRP